MLPLLCRILKLRKISAKHVLNSKGQEGVSVKVTCLQIFQNSTLTGLRAEKQLSLTENDFHTKNDQI